MTKPRLCVICGIEFVGRSTAKYCDEHQPPSRVRHRDWQRANRSNSQRHYVSPDQFSCSCGQVFIKHGVQTALCPGCGKEVQAGTQTRHTMSYYDHLEKKHGAYKARKMIREASELIFTKKELKAMAENSKHYLKPRFFVRDWERYKKSKQQK